MFPMLPIDNTLCRTDSDAVFQGKGNSAFAVQLARTHFFYFFYCHFSFMVIFSGWVSFGVFAPWVIIPAWQSFRIKACAAAVTGCHSALAARVLHVVNVSAQKKMGRADTSWRVAFMANNNLMRDDTPGDEICKFVSANFDRRIAGAEKTVPSVRSSTKPQPTGAVWPLTWSFVYLVPETFSDWYDILIMHHDSPIRLSWCCGQASEDSTFAPVLLF